MSFTGGVYYTKYPGGRRLIRSEGTRHLNIELAGISEHTEPQEKEYPTHADPTIDSACPQLVRPQLARSFRQQLARSFRQTFANLHDQPQQERYPRRVITVAITAALGGLIFGCTMGGSGMTFLMDGFKENFGWDSAPQRQIDIEMGLISGLLCVGAALAALFTPHLFDNRGRKPTIAWGAVIFTIGAAIQAAATNMPMLYIPRLLSGAGVGILSMCCPVYIAEIAPESQRGQLVMLWQLAIVGGILLASALNIKLAEWSEGWRISYGGSIVFSVTLLLLLTAMPESPHFLISKGRYDEAKSALGKVRFEDQAEWELHELEKEAKKAEARGEASWREMFDNNNNKMKNRLLLGILLHACKQFSGMNAILNYAATIFEGLFGPKGGMYGSLALNTVFFLSTFATAAKIDKYGRVSLLIGGGILILVTLIPSAVLSSFGQSGQGIGIGITTLAGLFVVGFAISWGPVPWVVCAEIYPVRERGKAICLATFSNWFCAMLLVTIFPIASSASFTGCLAFFAAAQFLAILVVYFFLPETANRTAPEIDREFLTHKLRLPFKT